MKHYNSNILLLYAKRLNCSNTGCPRHEVTVMIEGFIIIAKTATNAKINYILDSGKLDIWLDCKYHFTKTNQCIIDDFNSQEYYVERSFKK